MNKYRTHIIWIVVALLAFGGGIFLGRGMAAPGGGGYAGAQTGGGRAAFAGRGGAAGGFAAGQVSAIDAQSITLQLQNGNSENVYYSSSTEVVVPQPATIASIKPGTVIVVGGTQNPDGSMTASTIQVRNGTFPGPGTGK